MERNFNDDVYSFVHACHKNNVRMIMVGGSAVNFYGYKRHSADIDFWIDSGVENFDHLKLALNEIGYHLGVFPEKVLNAEQNISLKLSPDMEIELITRFNFGKTFDEAMSETVEYIVDTEKYYKWNILSYADLLSSKLKSGRPKDILDIQELQRINA